MNPSCFDNNKMREREAMVCIRLCAWFIVLLLYLLLSVKCNADRWG